MKISLSRIHFSTLFGAELIIGKECGNETLQLFTDGSRNEQGVGAGVSIFLG